MDVFMLEGNCGDFQYEMANSKNRYSLGAVFRRSMEARRWMMKIQALSAAFIFPGCFFT